MAWMTRNWNFYKTSPNTFLYRIGILSRLNTSSNAKAISKKRNDKPSTTKIFTNTSWRMHIKCWNYLPIVLICKSKSNFDL